MVAAVWDYMNTYTSNKHFLLSLREGNSGSLETFNVSLKIFHVVASAPSELLQCRDGRLHWWLYDSQVNTSGLKWNKRMIASWWGFKQTFVVYNLLGWCTCSRELHDSCNYIAGACTAPLVGYWPVHASHLFKILMICCCSAVAGYKMIYNLPIINDL